MKLGEVIIFKALAGGYRAKAIGRIEIGFNSHVEVGNITMLVTSTDKAYCSHRVGYNDIIRTVPEDYLIGENIKERVLEDFPELLI